MASDFGKISKIIQLAYPKPGDVIMFEVEDTDAIPRLSKSLEGFMHSHPGVKFLIYVKDDVRFAGIVPEGQAKRLFDKLELETISPS